MIPAKLTTVTPLIPAEGEAIVGTSYFRLGTDEGQGINFPDMQTLADWVGGAVGLVNGWRADGELAALEGLRKQTADAIIAEFRKQIAEKDPEAAKLFPEDVLFGGQWHIDVRKADDPNYVQITIEQHIKALITSVANCFAMAQKAA